MHLSMPTKYKLFFSSDDAMEKEITFVGKAINLLLIDRAEKKSRVILRDVFIRV